MAVQLDLAMDLKIFPDADAVARSAAGFLAPEAREAMAARGRFVIAVSGGKTPWAMLRALAEEQVPWSGMEIVQVDERVAPAGHPDRNLTHLQESLLAHSPLLPERIHAMPVERSDLETAAAEYARTLEGLAGAPPGLHVFPLRLGP